MKQRSLTFWAQLLMSSLIFLLAGSPNDFEKILDNLEKQTFDYVQEKVYLHLDRPYYSLGDDLWFKAYTVAGPNHTPTPLSENLYVELISPQGDLIKRLTVFMSKGLGKGDFLLADSLGAGDYRIRAYTNWMRNFDERFFFHRNFRVINPFDVQEDAVTQESTRFGRITPEGGALIASVPNRVALYQEGFEAGTEGKVLSEDGAVVTAFKLNERGMGLFSLLPEKGKKYRVKFDGSPILMPIPEAQHSGYVLSVDNLSSETEVLVSVKTAASEQRHLAYLVAHTRGNVGFASKLDWKGSTARLKIPRKELGDGITHLTLFNESWLPEAERLIFQHYHGHQLNLSLSTDKEEYTQRDSTTITLKLKDPEGKPLTGFFSMNVYDAAQISPDARQENIMSYFLLSSDLGDRLDAPMSLMGNDAASRAALDLILMTKGWRRFTWKDLLNDEFPETPHAVEQGFSVTGRVTQRNGSKGLSKAKVQQVGAFEGIPLFAQAETDGKGNFEMKGLHFYAGESILKAKDKKGKSSVALSLDNMEKTEFPAISISKDMSLVPAMASAEFTNVSKDRRQVELTYDTTGVIDLGTVVVEADEIDQNFANMQRGLVFGRGEFSVNVSDLMADGQNFVNALYTVQRVPGVTITLDAQSPEPNVQMTRKVWSLSNPDPPIQYYIDDSPVDLAAITSLPAALVERVEILKGMRATSMFGPSANGGAMLFYTKNREEQDAYLAKVRAKNPLIDKSTAGLRTGYYHSREFFMPDYRGEALKNPKPDFRDLIHWAPMIRTDENGEAKVRFFNADLKTSIRIEVEGIWEGGFPLVGAKEYKVRD